jgi:hypothetical protein
MERLQTVGVGLAVLSFAGYAIGIWVTYPGRAFSITGFMVGVTLYAMGGSG